MAADAVVAAGRARHRDRGAHGGGGRDHVRTVRPRVRRARRAIVAQLRGRGDDHPRRRRMGRAVWNMAAGRSRGCLGDPRRDVVRHRPAEPGAGVEWPVGLDRIVEGLRSAPRWGRAFPERNGCRGSATAVPPGRLLGIVSPAGPSGPVAGRCRDPGRAPLVRDVSDVQPRRAPVASWTRDRHRLADPSSGRTGRPGRRDRRRPRPAPVLPRAARPRRS